MQLQCGNIYIVQVFGLTWAVAYFKCEQFERDSIYTVWVFRSYFSCDLFSLVKRAVMTLQNKRNPNGRSKPILRISPFKRFPWMTCARKESFFDPSHKIRTFLFLLNPWTRNVPLIGYQEQNNKRTKRKQREKKEQKSIQPLKEYRVALTIFG